MDTEMKQTDMYGVFKLRMYALHLYTTNQYQPIQEARGGGEASEVLGQG